MFETYKMVMTNADNPRDPHLGHAAPGKPVFNRSVTLRDTWAKMQKKK